MPYSQIGDVAVLDISATTIGQDESNVKKIPSAGSKGSTMSREVSQFLFVVHN